MHAVRRAGLVPRRLLLCCSLFAVIAVLIGVAGAAVHLRTEKGLVSDEGGSRKDMRSRSSLMGNEIFVVGLDRRDFTGGGE
jgi:hypothetical protein